MAHPDERRQGSEKGQREHAGRTSEASDAGMQTKSQGATGKGPTPSAGTPVQGGPGQDRPDRSDAPEGEARELEGRPAMADRGLEASGDTRSTDPRAQPTPPDAAQRDRTGRREG
jgi:hypothetical protein